jgi:AraC-like DNA-binding protein
VGDDEPVLPDGSPELIFNLGDPFEHVAYDGTVTRQPSTFLVGQITGPFHVRPTGRIELFAVRFEAHGASLLHDDLQSITNHWAEAWELSDAGAVDVAASLQSTDSRDTRVALVEQWLADRSRSSPTPDREVARAVSTIRTARGAVRLDSLAADLGILPRTLHRRFARQVGIAPKLLARIVRFQAVFTAWRDNARTVGRVAAECGYADHAHLVRDFRDFAGEAPAKMLSSMPGFTSLFTP